MTSGAKRILDEIHQIREDMQARYRGVSNEERARVTNEEAWRALEEYGIKPKSVRPPDSQAA